MADPDLQLVREIADDLPVGVWVARAPSGEFLYANRTFAEIMGQAGRDDVRVGEYSEPYRIFRSDGVPYPESDMPFVRALSAREVVVADDIVIHRPDGHRVPIRAHARPIFGERGEVSHIVIVFFDITKEVEAERGRRDADARLRHSEKMQTIGLLAGGIAHDFNNVLAVVRVLTSRLHADEPDEARRALLAELDGAAESGARLAQQLLVLGGQGRSASTEVRLASLAGTVARLLDRTLDRRFAVSFEASGDDIVVHGDPSRLEQVVMNLAFNARDAMRGTGGTLAVTVRSAELDAGAASRLPPLRPGLHAILEVSDTGPGIPPEIRPRIFEPYFTTRTTGEHRGTGLGLSTVYGIVDAHGGTIEIADRVPHGTTMRVWLPGRRPTAARRVEAEPATAPRARRGGTVLFVDDEAALCRSCSAALGALGYDVIVAANGRDAVSIVADEGSALVAVLLDLVMPGMDGRSTYQAIRALDPEVPVILMTGTPLDAAAEELLAAGIRELVVKPYTTDDLADAIERARLGAP